MNGLTFDYLALRNEINPFSEPKPTGCTVQVGRTQNVAYPAQEPAKNITRKTELIVQLSLAEILMEQGDYSSAQLIVTEAASLAQYCGEGAKVLEQCKRLAAHIHLRYQ